MCLSPLSLLSLHVSCRVLFCLILSSLVRVVLVLALALASCSSPRCALVFLWSGVTLHRAWFPLNSSPVFASVVSDLALSCLVISLSYLI